MNKIIYQLSSEPAHEYEIEDFRRVFQEEQKEQCSQVFLDFCRADNGGSLSSGKFKPLKKYKLYWLYTRGRVLERPSFIELIELLGVSSNNERFSLVPDTLNARNVWELEKDFYVIGSDIYGFRIISKLREGDDKVYFWEPNVEPHFFLIADTLGEFYQNIVSE
ncbi:hypothetical protein EI77_04444 [Prosthecobacter fusiformis]|uniref:Knr4/Smi1-like domain-containing protein n=1 Tax=Prosthecobacter fusiformis TaxID=48464 RepID=A0A4R7RK87_9BACT|nr:SMI1/KNR4 family protein [Prosthecobacter fusiformis]TDU63235.1 hypothetical protein EI77_04444 [Prosthecobacter fusiformis]